MIENFNNPQICQAIIRVIDTYAMESAWILYVRF